MYPTHATVKRLSLKKKSGWNVISIHDFCDTRAVLYQLSLQANWKLITLKSSYTPQEDKDMEVNTVEPLCATISCKRQPPITEPV